MWKLNFITVSLAMPIKTIWLFLRDLPPEKLAEHGLAFEDKRIPELLFHYRQDISIKR